jgi:hypothetical protein
MTPTTLGDMTLNNHPGSPSKSDQAFASVLAAAAQYCEALVDGDIQRLNFFRQQIDSLYWRHLDEKRSIH